MSSTKRGTKGRIGESYAVLLHRMFLFEKLEQRCVLTTLIDGPEPIADPIVIDFDTPPSDSISGLRAVGVTINSLDPIATPFLSNVGGPGVGPLSTNAIGNNQNGHFSTASPFDPSAVRDFEIVFSSAVGAAGFNVQGWQGLAADHQLSARDTNGNVLGGFAFSQSSLQINDSGDNGFIGIDGQGALIKSLVFTPGANIDFIAFDNLTVEVLNTPPVVSIESPLTTVKEGDEVTYSYSASDPDSALFDLSAATCGSAGILSDSTFVTEDVSFDAGAGFSLAANPGGTWSYGFRNTVASTDFTAFSLADTSFLGRTDLHAWHVSDLSPSVSQNVGMSTIQVDTTVWDPGQLVIHPGTSATSTDEDAVLRWTSPADGVYDIDVKFTGIADKGGSGVATTTGVAVIDTAGAALFSADISGGFGTAANSHSFATALTLSAGDTIDFVANRGLSHGSDSTAVDVTIESFLGSGSFDCTFSDGPATSDVRVTVVDDESASGTTGFEVTVNNVAPEVIADDLAVTVDEGATASNTGSFADPGADIVSVTASAGTVSQQGTQDGTWSWSFDTVGNSSTGEVLFGEDFEGDLSQWVGKNGGAHHGVIVADPLRPSNQVLTFNGANLAGDMFGTEVAISPDETYLLSFEYLGLFQPGTGADPTNLGGFIGFSESTSPGGHRWLGGAALEGGAENAVELLDDGQWHTYEIEFEPIVELFVGGVPRHPLNDVIRLMLEDANNPIGNTFFDNIALTSASKIPSQVTITATDSDGESNDAVFDLHVVNVAPTVTLSGPVSTDEGETKSYSFATSDPGDDTFSLVSQSCGSNGTLSNATFDSTTGAGSFDCNFPDGPASSNLSVEVADSDSSALSDSILDFDGGDRVIVPNSASLNPTELTVEMLVNFDRFASNADPSGAGGQFLITKGGDRTSGAYRLLQNAVTGGPPRLGFSIGPCCLGPGTVGVGAEVPSLSTNRWYHVAGTYDGTILRLFLDGEEIASETFAAVPVGNSSPLYLSYNDVGGFPYYLDGQMDEVRVWNYARSQTEIQASMSSPLGGSESGLVGYWNFNESPTTSQTAFDATTNGNDAQLGSTSSVDSDDPTRVNIDLSLSGGDMLSVDVTNVAPIVSLNGPVTADEGETKSYSFTTSDPGDDTFSLASQSCGSNGTLSNATFDSTTGAGSFDCNFPDGPASSNLSVEVADSDGANSNIAIVTVAVANVAPEVTADDSTVTVDEGATALNTGSFADPGSDIVTIVASTPGGGGGTTGTVTLDAGGFGTPDELGSINSTDRDVQPDISADGLRLFFGTRRSGGIGDDDIWMSERASLADPFQPPVHLGNVINSGSRDHAPEESADGLNLYFFSFAHSGLAVATRPTTSVPWTDTSVSVSNSEFANIRAGAAFAEHGTVSADGSTLIYQGRASGSVDLWMSTRANAADPWGTPTLLSNISGPYDEAHPDFSDDGLSLYFSSNLPDGGGYDLYSARRSVTSVSWNDPSVTVEPVTESAPGSINSPAHESGPSAFGSGELYFVSTPLDALGNPNLYVAKAVGDTWSWSFQTSDGPDQSQVVTITATDGDGASSSTNFQLNVNNIPPVFDIGPDETLPVASAGVFSRTGVSFVDPGADIWSGTVNFDDGTGDFVVDIDQLNKTLELSHTFSAEGTFVVTVILDDGDGGDHTDNFLVTVDLNTPPVATASGPYSGSEGTAIPLNNASASDADGDPLTISWTVDNPGVCSFSDPAVVNPELTCDDNGSYQVTLTVDDGMANPVTSQAAVTVANVAPTVEISGPVSANEGQTKNYSFTTSDPGNDTFSLVSQSCGGNGTLSNAAFDGPTGAGSFDCTFPDGPASSDVSVQIADSDGANSNLDSLTVIVSNVAPTVTSITLPLAPINITDLPSFTVDVDFTDPAGTNDEPYSCLFDMDGDGALDITVLDVTGTSCSATLSYTGPGVYTVKVLITDKDGDSAVAEATDFIVIYDPEGGFVTGGGWIDSPEGAYVEDPTLTGKANFGFVSKYKKGASTPSGQTEFQFKAGDLNFHSTSYDWLVIAGHKAMYKGGGTINGQGDYRFQLSAIDAELTPSTEVDLLRMRIWQDGSNGGLIYDNKVGEDDPNADPSTALGGGNIKIHKAKKSAALAIAPGDANYDGVVDFEDFLVLAANYGRQSASHEDGDFDGNGRVGFVDFLILADRYDSKLPTPSASNVGSPVARAIDEAFDERRPENDWWFEFEESGQDSDSDLFELRGP